MRPAQLLDPWSARSPVGRDSSFIGARLAGVWGAGTRPGLAREPRGKIRGIDPAGLRNCAVPARLLALPRGVPSDKSMKRIAPILLLLLSAMLGWSASSSGRPASSDLGLTLRKLARWTDSPAQSEGDKLGQGADLLREVDLLWSGRHASDPRILHGMLDFLGRSIELARDPEALISGPRTGDIAEVNEPELRDLALKMLRKRLDLLANELTLGILLGTSKGQPQPLSRRVAACEVLAADPSPETTVALLACTRPRKPETIVPKALMDSAIAALVGRDEVGVHLRLLTLIKRADPGLEAFYTHPIEVHFASFRFKNDQKTVISALSLQAAKDLSSPDWRRASRGVVLAQALPDELGFPLVIGALEAWVERGLLNEGPSRRVLGEITAHLWSRSGKSLGHHPSRWRAFWDAYLRGEELPEGTSSGPSMRIGGSFFGLRPETDRLVFLLDRSGSMNAPFGADPHHRRLDEAAQQMSSLLGQLGPDTRFGVVVFHDSAQTWQTELQLATEANIDAASAWIKGSKADRGSHLYAGVREVMQLAGDPSGTEAGPLEADTVVVLCDGETQEGPSWVEPLLRQVNDRVRLVFHAVLLGPGGDGTLEALAGLTGGQFRRHED